MIRFIRKLIVVFLLAIYIAGSLNFILTYTIHLLHHVVTNTLHQHQHQEHDHYAMHSHFSDDHRHEHSHSHAIDLAIREVNDANQDKENPYTLPEGVDVKFSSHFSSTTENIKVFSGEAIIKEAYLIIYDDQFIKPPSPPPKLYF